jgi:uncharacterized protein YkwD
MERQHLLAGLLVVATLVFAQLVTTGLAVATPPVAVGLEEGSEEIGWRPATETDDLARDIFDRVNEERAARQLHRLRWDEGLADLARRWSEEMIATGYRHSEPEFRRHPAFAGTGENIYMGPRDTGEGHVGWMESAGHRDNLLLPQFTAIGIGVVCRNDGHMWATQILGFPHGATPTPWSWPEEPIVRRDEGLPCPTEDRGWWPPWGG